MTVTGATSLLFLFKSKIEDAVGLVPDMCAEEKLKAVQFWNVVSEKLQEIVNSSAADINALALKMDEERSNKLNLTDNESATSDIVDQSNICSTDFMHLASNYSVCNEADTQYNPDISNSHMKQLFSSNDSLSSTAETSLPNELTATLPHIEQLSEAIGICEKLTKDNDVSNSQTFLNSTPLPNDSCDNMFVIDPECSRMPKSIPLPQNLKSNQSQTNKRVPNRLKKQRVATLRRSKLSLLTNDENNDALTIMPQMLDGSKASSKLLEPLSTKRSKLRSAGKAVSECEKILTSVSNLCENPKDCSSDRSGLNMSNLEQTNNPEHVVSFVVSNSEEILENNEVNSNKLAERKCDEEGQLGYTCPQWNSKTYTCDECPAQFSTRGNLIVHLRKHTGEKPYCCSQCSARFSTKGNLKRHIKTHSGEKPWQCSQCDSCFTEKKSLNVHMRRHTGEKPYECQVCGKKFAQTGILHTHMAMHLDEKAHLCEHCGKSFRQKSQLRLHKLRHDGVRKYLCVSCPARFLTKGDLERHMRIHTGERPYLCELCSKTFTRQQSLNEHMNRHYGLTPYICKYCGKSFAEMSACYKHIKQHEKSSEVDDIKMQQEFGHVSSKGGADHEIENEFNEIHQQNFAIILNTSRSTIDTASDGQSNQAIAVISSSATEENNVANSIADFAAINLLANASTHQESF